MSIEISDYIPVTKKLIRFGASVPSGLAILPRNLEKAESKEELRQVVESDTVRTLLKANGIDYTEIFDENKQPPYLQQYSFEWFGPVLFITSSLFTQNPTILSVTLGIITNYLYDLFKGSGNGRTSLDVIYQHSDGSCKKIHYSGTPDGLNKVAEIIRNLENKKE